MNKRQMEQKVQQVCVYATDTAWPDLAASSAVLVCTATSKLVIIVEEVGVALISEGQAHDSLRVVHGVTFTV